MKDLQKDEGFEERMKDLQKDELFEERMKDTVEMMEDLKRV